jgi:hypothetical protein
VSAIHSNTLQASGCTRSRSTPHAGTAPSNSSDVTNPLPKQTLNHVQIMYVSNTLVSLSCIPVVVQKGALTYSSEKKKEKGKEMNQLPYKKYLVSSIPHQ